MFTIFSINRSSVKPALGMFTPKKAVSTDAIQQEWIEIQAAQKNAAKFRPLYVRYYEPIFRFILRRTGDESLTADLCSQVFLKAMQKLKNYQFKGVPFSAWLYRIASNEVAQHFRNASKNRTVDIEDTNLGEMIEEIGDDLKEQDQAMLLAVLDTLSDSDMQLIELRFFEQRQFKEIAAILDITEGNAKVKTYRILAKLKKRIIAKTGK